MIGVEDDGAGVGIRFICGFCGSAEYADARAVVLDAEHRILRRASLRLRLRLLPCLVRALDTNCSRTEVRASPGLQAASLAQNLRTCGGYARRPSPCLGKQSYYVRHM